MNFHESLLKYFTTTGDWSNRNFDFFINYDFYIYHECCKVKLILFSSPKFMKHAIIKMMILKFAFIHLRIFCEAYDNEYERKVYIHSKINLYQFLMWSTESLYNINIHRIIINHNALLIINVIDFWVEI